MSVEHHPHDTNFKHNFGNKKVARDFLMHNLPQMVLDQIDLSTLEIESPEFIGSKHRGKRSADIVYSVKTKCGKCIYALVHLEAEGKHTKDMGIRVFEYHAGIARSHYRKEGSGKIPLILTFVLYYGKETWTSPTSIADMFEDFDLYVNISLKAPFLIRLDKAKIDALKKQGASSGPQLMMQGRAKGDFCSMLEDILPLLKSHDLLDKENIHYMITHDKHTPATFLKKLHTLAPENTNDYNTMFELAVERGIQEKMQIIIHKIALKVTEDLMPKMGQTMDQQAADTMVQDMAHTITELIAQESAKKAAAQSLQQARKESMQRVASFMEAEGFDPKVITNTTQFIKGEINVPS